VGVQNGECGRLPAQVKYTVIAALVVVNGQPLIQSEKEKVKAAILNMSGWKSWRNMTNVHAAQGSGK
jgi:hypothetical protein